MRIQSSTCPYPFTPPKTNKTRTAAPDSLANIRCICCDKPETKDILKEIFLTIPMNERYIQILGILLTAGGFAFVAFLYWAEPRNFAEVTTKGQVVLGTYVINKSEFN